MPFGGALRQAQDRRDTCFTDLMWTGETLVLLSEYFFNTALRVPLAVGLFVLLLGDELPRILAALLGAVSFLYLRGKK